MSHLDNNNRQLRWSCQIPKMEVLCIKLWAFSPSACLVWSIFMHTKFLYLQVCLLNSQKKKKKKTRAYIEKMWNWLLQVDNSDPNAIKTLSRLEAAQKSCRESGALNKRFVNLSIEHWMVFFFSFFFWLTLFLSSTRKSYIIRNEPKYNSVLVSFCWIVNLISSRACIVASFLFQAIHLFLITCYAYKFQHRLELAGLYIFLILIFLWNMHFIWYELDRKRMNEINFPPSFPIVLINRQLDAYTSLVCFAGSKNINWEYHLISFII